VSSTNEPSAKEAEIDAFCAQLPQTYASSLEERVAAGKALRNHAIPSSDHRRAALCFPESLTGCV